MATTIAVTALLTGRFEAPQVWKLEIPAIDPKKAADLVYEISNCPPHLLRAEDRGILEKFPRTKIRSLSVGDVLIIQDPEKPEVRHIATCDNFGWTFH